MVGYYRNFTENSELISASLRKLWKKRASFDWTNEQTDSFTNLKMICVMSQFCIIHDMINLLYHSNERK